MSILSIDSMKRPQTALPGTIKIDKSKSSSSIVIVVVGAVVVVLNAVVVSVDASS